ncbi:MAG: GAF domain-containing sensor histidine kinase [Anaerolineales bacterium]|nr:MAG: GAF domain-containing sensor histidine kinase [Anaerolineales bacterium]
MEEKEVVPPRTPVEEELVGRVAWQIQLRWFAALGVLTATWFASSILDIQLPQWPLYTIGLSILLYNILFRLYLERRFSYPSRTKSSGYIYSALFRFHLKRLEREAPATAAIFDRFAKVQTSLDWLAMILLVHFSGGVESPLLFYFIFHLIIASILFSPLACYFFATLAAFAVGALATLEYGGLIPHISLGFISIPLYQNGLYIASLLFFFTTCLYISVYMATSVTLNLRQKDRELLRLQQRLSSAYQRIQTLYEVTKTVSSTLNLEEVLNLIAQSAVEAMQVKACTIRLLDESGQMVDTVAAYGLSEQYLTKGPIDVQKSLQTYQTLSSGQPVIISDTSRDDRLQYPAEAKAEGINSMLCVPLFIKGKAEGVICVYRIEPDHFSESDAQFLSALASEGAIAIENARTYQALEMADRAKSDFVQMVTHELRSPLSAVQSMLRVLEEGYVGPITSKQQDLIQRSQRRVSFLLALVKDLLELAAGKVEQLKGEKTEVVLNETITKVTELMQTSTEEKGLELKVEIAEEPLVLVGIEDGLERIFMNLLSNAVKYTPAGGSVVVRAWSEDGQIRIEISDTGIGIPEEALPRIFNEFYRAKNAKAMEMEGTGLGLAIAKDVVEQHGGQISVESVVGKGSTFYVNLPKG